MLAERWDGRRRDSALFELHTVSGGNPLFLLEIARASLRDPERSLVVPRSLHEQVSERLSMLPAATREALVVTASLPRPTLGLIERAVECGGKDILGPAVRAGTVEVLGDSVRFTHPLYGSVSYADARSEERARIHRRLAWLVTDPEERARHLALGTTPPDGGVADVLEEAAERARSAVPRWPRRICASRRGGSRRKNEEKTHGVAPCWPPMTSTSPETKRE
jgi:hypothetical protein